MTCSSHLTGFIFIALAFLVLPAQRAVAQDNPDDKPHIQPRATPTPTPSPAPPAKTSQQPQKPQDGYEKPPFPGDVTPPGSNQPSPKPQDKQYERPPFPGDAPGASPTGESSSRDS